ncbi:MAG: hypothetical protein ACJATI_000128 [Halioglobus sp.]|jgi:hypothetical protein
MNKLFFVLVFILALNQLLGQSSNVEFNNAIPAWTHLAIDSTKNSGDNLDGKKPLDLYRN